jgi:hypothetical protein
LQSTVPVISDLDPGLIFISKPDPLEQITSDPGGSGSGSATLEYCPMSLRGRERVKEKEGKIKGK